jgi:hypothetical protein
MTHSYPEKPAKVEIIKTDSALSICIPPRFHPALILLTAVSLVSFLTPFMIASSYKVDALSYIGSHRIEMFFITLFSWSFGFIITHMTLIYYLAQIDFYVDGQTINRILRLFGHRFGKVKAIPIHEIKKIEMFASYSSGDHGETPMPPKLLLHFDKSSSACTPADSVLYDMILIHFEREKTNLIGLFLGIVPNSLCNDLTVNWLGCELGKWLNVPYKNWR